MQKDRLSDTPAYQRILKEGFEQGFEEGKREILQKALQEYREALFDLMLKRFPHLARQTIDYAETIDDLSKLSRFLIRMTTIPTVEGAEVLLQIMVEESKETN